MIGMVAILGGVTIIMVPLHGLGTDQANKSKQLSKGIEAWHVDEFVLVEANPDFTLRDDRKWDGFQLR